MYLFQVIIKSSSYKKFTVIFLGIIFSIILLELVLRLGGLAYSFLQEYRNRISAYQKGTFRIMCLGESTTALGGKDSYPNQLEEVLNQRNIGISFSVINAGMGGIDTTYILAHLEENLNKYRPDMVTAMMGSNDRYIKYYENIPEANTTLFRNFKTYKFLRILWMNVINKLKKPAVYSAAQLILGLKSCYAQQSNPQQDEESLKRSVERNPNSDEAYFKLGTFYREQGQYPKMEEALQKAIQLNPKSDIAYAQLGWYYTREKKYSQAEEFFKKALEQNPKEETYLAMGELYIFQDKFTQAEEAFRRALIVNPKSIEALSHLAWVNIKQRNCIKAEELFKKIIALNPVGAWNYNALAEIYIRQKRFSEAVEVYKKALQINPNDDKVYGGLAIVYKEMGRQDLAQECYRKANVLRSQGYSELTRRNYLKLKRILDQRGIKLVCVQYPMLSIEPLKNMLQDQEGLIFVDNEKVFNDALSQASYMDYFQDMFAGVFGHCTRKGNRLLAENIANVILKEYFRK